MTEDLERGGRNCNGWYFDIQGVGHRALTQVHLEHDAFQDQTKVLSTIVEQPAQKSVKIFQLDFRPKFLT